MHNVPRPSLRVSAPLKRYCGRAGPTEAEGGACAQFHRLPGRMPSVPTGRANDRHLHFPSLRLRPYAGGMKRRSAVVAACATATAAVAGNAFNAVGARYYGIAGYVTARAVDRGDAETVTWAGTVLVANEAWNALLFGRASPGAACSASRSRWRPCRGRCGRCGRTADHVRHSCPIPLGWSSTTFRGVTGYGASTDRPCRR